MFLYLFILLNIYVCQEIETIVSRKYETTAPTRLCLGCRYPRYARIFDAKNTHVARGGALRYDTANGCPLPFSIEIVAST